MAKPQNVNQWYGWRPDKPDHRDFKATLPSAVVLPPIVDLRAGFPKPYNQHELGSCTANAIAALLEFNQRKQGQKKPFTPSRLFIYYLEREIEGTIGEDAGAEIRDGIKAVNIFGAPPEKNWPYNQNKFHVKPTKNAYRIAKAHQSLRYERLNQRGAELQACLASGFPFAYGFTVYNSFDSDETTKTGLVRMPIGNEDTDGGHAVVGAGYTRDLKKVHSLGESLVLPDWARNVALWLIGRNSWDEDWGDKGYFYMPFEYITNSDLSADFWMIRQVE